MSDRDDLIRVDSTGAVHPVGRAASQQLRPRAGEWRLIASPKELIVARSMTGGDAVLMLGRGLAGRWEVSFEVDPAARGAGLGRRLATASRHLVPDAAPVFIQIAPGNVPSLRAILGVGGWTPIGGEVLFP